MEYTNNKIKTQTPNNANSLYGSTVAKSSSITESFYSFFFSNTLMEKSLTMPIVTIIQKEIQE